MVKYNIPKKHSTHKIPTGISLQEQLEERGEGETNKSLYSLSNEIIPEIGIVYSTGLPNSAESPTVDSLEEEAIDDKFAEAGELMQLPPGREQPLETFREMGDFVPMKGRLRSISSGDPMVHNLLYGSYRDEGMPRIPGSIGKIGEHNPIPYSDHLVEHLME